MVGSSQGTGRESSRQRLLDDERSVSGLIGYVLVFALAISGAFLLAIFGVSTLVGSGDISQVQTGLENIDRVDEGAVEVAEGAPVREVTVQPTDGSFAYRSEYSINISAKGPQVDLTGGNAINVTGTELIHSLGDGQNLTYASGLVAYQQSSSEQADLRRSPQFEISSTRAVFILPLTYQKGGSSSLISVSGSDKVPITLQRGTGSEINRVAVDGDGNIVSMNGTVEVRGSSVPAVWAEYFRKSQFEPTDLDGDGDAEYQADLDGDGEIEVAGGGFETERLFGNVVQISVALNTPA